MRPAIGTGRSQIWSPRTLPGPVSAQLREFLHRRDRADLDHRWIDLTCLAPESVVLEPLGGTPLELPTAAWSSSMELEMLPKENPTWATVASTVRWAG